MNLKFKVKSSSVDDGRFPSEGECEILGTNPFFIKINGKEFFLDSKSYCFNESCLAIEGMLGDDTEIIGRFLILLE